MERFLRLAGVGLGLWVISCVLIGARRSKTWWSPWIYPLAVFGASLLFALLSGAARAGHRS